MSLLDPATGTPLWQVAVRGRADGLSSSMSNSQALVELSATGTGTGGGHAGVQALRLRDGSPVWSLTADYVERTTAAGDVPAVTSGLDRSRARALNPTDGAVLWETAGVDPLVPDSPFLGGDHGQGFRRDPRTCTPQPGRVPFTYGLSASQELLVGAGARTLTAVRDGNQAGQFDYPMAPAPSPTWTSTPPPSPASPPSDNPKNATDVLPQPRRLGASSLTGSRSPTGKITAAFTACAGRTRLAARVAAAC